MKIFLTKFHFLQFQNDQKSIFELAKSLKLLKMQFHEKNLFLFDFRSIFAWTFFNFLARCEQYIYSVGLHVVINFDPGQNWWRTQNHATIITDHLIFEIGFATTKVFFRYDSIIISNRLILKLFLPPKVFSGLNISNQVHCGG